MSLTSKSRWLPATVAWRRNQFTVHDKHLPAAGGWLMLISCSDSSCEAKAPSGKFTKKFCSQLSNHAALCLRKENPQTGGKCSVLFSQTQTARLFKHTLGYQRLVTLKQLSLLFSTRSKLSVGQLWSREQAKLQYKVAQAGIFTTFQHYWKENCCVHSFSWKNDSSFKLVFYSHTVFLCL